MRPGDGNGWAWWNDRARLHLMQRLHRRLRQAASGERIDRPDARISPRRRRERTLGESGAGEGEEDEVDMFFRNDDGVQFTFTPSAADDYLDFSKSPCAILGWLVACCKPD
jgi:hypothetical protein